MKKLGKIIDTFTMRETSRVLLIDQDCSKDVHIGDTINVVSGLTTVKTKVLGTLLEKDNTSSLEVENVGFPSESIVGDEVFAQ